LFERSHGGEAAKLVETTQERWAEAEMHRLRGTLLLSMHQHSEAEDSYRQAIAVARRQSAKFWELRATVDLARLWHDQGKRTEARDLLAPIYGWFTEGFDTPILEDAKVLLDELRRCCSDFCSLVPRRCDRPPFARRRPDHG
jgi:predicted ATPase